MIDTDLESTLESGIVYHIQISFKLMTSRNLSNGVEQSYNKKIERVNAAVVKNRM